MFKKTKNGFILEISVAPNAAKNEIVFGDTVKVRVTASPIEGKANDAVVALLSKEFKVPKSKIEIVKGGLGRKKTVLFAVEKIDFPPSF